MTNYRDLIKEKILSSLKKELTHIELNYPLQYDYLEYLKNKIKKIEGEI